MAEPRRGEAPWQQRYRAPQVYWTRIAPGATSRGVAATNQTGVIQLYAWDVPTGALRQLTARAEGTVFGVISPDGRHVYYHDDQKGNEIGHFVRVPWEGGAAEDVTPSLPPYAPAGLAQSRDGRTLVISAVDGEGHHVYRVDGAAARELHRHARPTYAAGITADGALALVTTTARSETLHYALLALDAATGEQVAELWDGPQSSLTNVVCSPVAGDERVVAASDRTGAKRPLLWEPRSGERRDLPLDEVPGDVTPEDWSTDGGRLLLRQTHQAVHRLFVHELASGRTTALAERGTFGAAYFGPSGEVFAHRQGSEQPQRLVALDPGTGQITRTVLAASEAPPASPWRSVTFTSSGGQAIQAWLRTPAGAGPFPTVLETHGGPTAVAQEGFAPAAQAWVDHGFAFLSVNYRGSTTFGKAFMEKIWGDLGHWEVEDMVAAREWLVGERIAIADQVFLTGWSYGGYLTLLALGQRPELWAGGLAGIAIADWTMSYEDSSPLLRGYQRSLFGGTPEEKPDLYRRASPITYAERVAAPLLIIQGRNDTRTPARPIEAYERRMRELGKEVEVHWFDAGHSGPFADVERAIEHQEMMLGFARRVLEKRELSRV
jgi:dipeptidyl aminopeptidase/acylaminoacyl peptidase